MALHHVEAVMGTMISIDVVDSDAVGLITLLVDWFHHVDAVFSPYKDGSEISRIGRGELDPLQATSEVREVLDRCDELLTETRGVFDVWSLPSPNGTRFDPCGYVKGWSVERAASLLVDNGAERFMVNAGGDIVARGRRADDQPWRVGIRHPDDADALALVLQLDGHTCVATSGSYERGAHIIDPRTNQPATAVASATVIGPSLADADAYATTLAVMGADGLLWLAERDGYAGCVFADGTMVSTAEFNSFVAAQVVDWS